MRVQNRKLLMTQLDDRLQAFRQIPFEQRLPPRGGWVASIRKALGMSGKSLAQRLGVSQSAEAQFEKGERERKITLSTLEKIADALDADLVYAIVPRKPLAKILEDKAMEVAKERVLPLAHSMILENQATSEERLSSQVQELQKQLLERPGDLWR